MMPVMQTKRGGNDVPPEERGDCMPACLPHVIVMHGENVEHDPALASRYAKGPLPDGVEPLEGWVLVPRSHGHAK